MIQGFRLIGGAHSLRRTPWGEIIKAQLQMDEKHLKSRLKTGWHEQLQTQLDGLKSRVEAAHARWEQLREEYKKASYDRLQEVKWQLRMAKLEFRAAREQWRAYHSFLLQTA
jgi:uncharacterized protein YicC (UPF0701 family)